MASGSSSGQHQHGEYILDALQSLCVPSTFTDVVNHIANKQKVLASDIKDPVKSMLQKGVEYGFIQKLGGRYTTENLVEATNPEPNTPDTPQDRSRRRMPSYCHKRSRCSRRPKPRCRRPRPRRRRC